MKYFYSAILIIASSLYSKSSVGGEENYPLVYKNYNNVMYDIKVAPKTEYVESVKTEIVEEPKGRWVWAVVTAYSPHRESCGRWAKYGLTSTGIKVRTPNPDDAYGIAADPRVIPYGTKVYVPEYFEMLENNKNCVPTEMTEVDDTGGGMRQSARRGIIHIDVRFRTEKAAIAWGRKRMEIFIYDE